MTYAANLRKTHPEVTRIIWFGSWVNGVPLPHSDVDLCLVLNESDKPFKERVTDYLDGNLAGFPGGVDILPYTQAEFDRLPGTAPSLHTAISSGKEI